MLCLDTLTETLTLNESAPSSKDDSIENATLAQVSRFPLVDLKNNYLLVLGETGQSGYLLKITVKKGFRGEAVSSRHKVHLKVMHEFSVTKKVSCITNICVQKFSPT